MLRRRVGGSEMMGGTRSGGGGRCYGRREAYCCLASGDRGNRVLALMVVPDRGGWGRVADGECTLICDVSVSVNWWAGAVLLVTALAIALVARMWSGDLGRPWGGHRPVIWFLVVLILPPVGLVLFCVAAVKQVRSAPRRSEPAS